VRVRRLIGCVHIGCDLISALGQKRSSSLVGWSSARGQKRSSPFTGRKVG
jgi:hypothetical protein